MSSTKLTVYGEYRSPNYAIRIKNSAGLVYSLSQDLFTTFDKVSDPLILLFPDSADPLDVNASSYTLNLTASFVDGLYEVLFHDLDSSNKKVAQVSYLTVVNGQANVGPLNIYAIRWHIQNMSIGSTGLTLEAALQKLLTK